MSSDERMEKFVPLLAAAAAEAAPVIAGTAARFALWAGPRLIQARFLGGAAASIARTRAASVAASAARTKIGRVASAAASSKFGRAGRRVWNAVSHPGVQAGMTVGSLFGDDGKGSDRQLTEAEIEQRRKAGKASADKRRGQHQMVGKSDAGVMEKALLATLGAKVGGRFGRYFADRAFLNSPAARSTLRAARSKGERVWRAEEQEGRQAITGYLRRRFATGGSKDEHERATAAFAQRYQSLKGGPSAKAATFGAQEMKTARHNARVSGQQYGQGLGAVAGLGGDIGLAVGGALALASHFTKPASAAPGTREPVDRDGDGKVYDGTKDERPAPARVIAHKADEVLDLVKMAAEIDALPADQRAAALTKATFAIQQRVSA